MDKTSDQVSKLVFTQDSCSYSPGHCHCLDYPYNCVLTAHLLQRWTMNNLAHSINSNPSSAKATFSNAPFVNKYIPTAPADKAALNPTTTVLSQISRSY